MREKRLPAAWQLSETDAGGDMDFAGKHNLRDAGTAVLVRDLVDRMHGKRLRYHDLTESKSKC